MQGKLPEVAFKLLQDHNLIDKWRLQHKESRDFSFYSGRFNSWSRIDITFISKVLCKEETMTEIMPRI